MKNGSYEGFETFLSAFQMAIKLHLSAVIAIFVVQVFLILLMNDLKKPDTQLLISWYKVRILASAPLDIKTKINLDDQTYEGNAKQFANNDQLKRMVEGKKEKYLNQILLSCTLYILYPIIIIFFNRRSKIQSQREYIRGARLLSTKEINKRFRQKKEVLDLPLGSIKLPKSLENRQTLLIGKPGSGKTQALRPILNRLIERGEQGICYDNKGDYFPESFNPDKDILFNPLDQRSVGWNLFNELFSYPDIDAVAASLIPPSRSKADSFWNDAARGVFSGILHYLFQHGLRNNYELWKLLTADAQDIAAKLKNTKGGEAGYRYITQNAENSRQAESVLAVMMQYTKCFEYMVSNDGDLTINKWLEEGKGFIYITNYDVIEETLRPILSLFIDLLSRKLLSMPDSNTRRIYLHLDEFGSLQRLPTLINLLTKGRSKGACSFLGIQDDGQMEQIYTENLRKSIDNACGNRITFGLSGETAERESKYNIGPSEYYETNRSMSMGPHAMRDGVSLQKNKKTAPLFLPSDISNIEDLKAIVRLKNYDFTLSEWKYIQANPVHPPFILREDLILENILADINKTKNNINERIDKIIDNATFDTIEN